MFFFSVRTLHENLSVPVFCKMRVFTDMEKTLNFAKMLEKAGCQLLAVHGRTKEMKGINVGVADWAYIKKIKLK
jgi:tRNA-dihydrouridine synthase 1